MAEKIPGAIQQRDKSRYAVVPRTPAGLMTADQLEALAKAVRAYDIPIVKITSGQRIALVGMTEDQLEPLWNDLGMDKGKATELCVHYAQACPGTETCKYGVGDSIALGLELEKLFQGVDLPAKFKFGISGCPMCCGESYVRDFGAFAKKSGWTVIVGGNAGGRARIGDVLAEELSEEQVVDLARRCIDYYRENARKRERVSMFVSRVGVDAVKQAVLE